MLSDKITLPKVLLDSDHEYIKPSKAIVNESMMNGWKASDAYHVQFSRLFLRQRKRRIAQCVLSRNLAGKLRFKLFQEYFGFIKAMNLAVRGKSNNHQCHVSDITKGILNVISSLDNMLTEIPPIDQPQRFGNKAFKTWYERLQQVRRRLYFVLFRIQLFVKK